MYIYDCLVAIPDGEEIYHNETCRSRFTTIHSLHAIKWHICSFAILKYKKER